MGKTGNSPCVGAKNILKSIDKIDFSWIPDDTIVLKNQSNVSNEGFAHYSKIARYETSKENALTAIRCSDDIIHVSNVEQVTGNSNIDVN